MRIGHGYDVHRLTPGRKLILGGVEIPYALGLDGHSDADVLTHAVMDALLGAARAGDIGKLRITVTVCLVIEYSVKYFVLRSCHSRLKT